MIDINGLDKAAVLAALYNNSHRLRRIHEDPRNVMTVKLAEDLIEDLKVDGRLNFDYLRGRPIKVDITKDSFDPYLYDRDNGEGAAAKAIEPLRGK